MPAQAFDIEAVSELADRLQLPRQGEPPASFLMSNNKRDWYERIYRASRESPPHVRFLVAHSDAAVMGFIIAYDETWVQAGALGATEMAILSWRNQASGGSSFWVIKQVAVDRAYQRLGLGRSLYMALIDSQPSTRIFAAIVANPRNEPSERLHASLGFVPLLAAQSVDPLSGTAYPNRVWCRDP
jgi:GNAT superfamily N-acetyltransferase